jgi:hypothetical protein
LTLAIVGTGWVLYATATKFGIGLDSDSAVYIGAARSLLEGEGLRIYYGSGPPIGTWAPMFPLALGLIGTMGVDPVDGARVLNAALFGAAILLVGLALWRYTQGSLFIPLFGSFLVVCSVDMLKIYSMAWSEPLFLFACTVALLLAAAFIDTSRRSLLIGCSVAIGIAYLSRYAGIVLVVTVMMGIVLFGKNAPYRRIRDSILLGVLSSLPIVLWPIINSFHDNSTTIREISFHPIIRNNSEKGLSTVLAWVLPDRVVDWLMPGGAWFALALMSVLLVGAMVVRQRERGKGSSEVATQQPLQSLPWFLFIFIVTYIVFLIAVISFVDGDIRLYYRLLSPVFLTGVLLIMCLGYDLLFVKRNCPKSQMVVVLLAVVFGGATLYQAGTWVQEARAEGLGYSSAAWWSSELVELVRKIPPHMSIYTNRHEVIYLMTGKKSTRIPIKWNTHKHRPKRDYQRKLSDMKEQVIKEDAVVVYFQGEERGFLAPEKELIESMPLKLAQIARDGRIYRVIP